MAGTVLMFGDGLLDLHMEPFDITYAGLDVRVCKPGNVAFHLFHGDELVAMMVPEMVGGELAWSSPHMVAMDARLIGEVIASRLI